MKIGAGDLAAAVFLQEEVPGWLYQVKNGATTIWERWDALGSDGLPHDSSMNSYNHYAYGAVCQWLLESVAGFRPDEQTPGFEHIIFEPLIIPEIAPVKAHHDSIVGKITASWEVDGQNVIYRVNVPESAHGTFVANSNYKDVKIDGVATPTKKDEQLRMPLASGYHEITFVLKSEEGGVRRG